MFRTQHNSAHELSHAYVISCRKDAATDSAERAGDLNKHADDQSQVGSSDQSDAEVDDSDNSNMADSDDSAHYERYRHPLRVPGSSAVDSVSAAPAGVPRYIGRHVANRSMPMSARVQSARVRKASAMARVRKASAAARVRKASAVASAVAAPTPAPAAPTTAPACAPSAPTLACAAAAPTPAPAVGADAAAAHRISLSREILAFAQGAVALPPRNRAPTRAFLEGLDLD